MGENPIGRRCDDLELTRLIGAVAEDACRSLGALYDASSDLVYKISMLVLRDRVAAESSAVRAYGLIVQRARSFDPGRCSPRAWLVTIAYAEARRRRRGAWGR